MKHNVCLLIFLYSSLVFSTNSTSLPQKTPASCYYAAAAGTITGKWTPTAWGIYLAVYGALPIVATVVISVLKNKVPWLAPYLPSSTVAGNTQPFAAPAALAGELALSQVTVDDVINHPSTPTWVKTVLQGAKLVGGKGIIPGIGSSGLGCTDIITILMFVFTSGAYAAEEFFQGQCDYESQP